MRLHVVLPAESPDATPDVIAGLARGAEQLGYEAAWLPDHPLPPLRHGRTYGGVYEPLTTLAYVAGATSRIRLGTSLLVLPLYNPFVVARQAATLDHLSGGRFTLGVGIGWEAAEFRSLGVDFAERAGRTDEALRLLRHLFDEGEGPFASEQFGFESGIFSPHPSHGLRIMVGGASRAALRRAARHADIWQSPPLPPAEFAERVKALRALSSRRIEVGGRSEWTGTTPLETAVEEALEWQVAGAQHLAVWFGDVAGFEERMTILARAIESRRAASKNR